MLTELIKKIFGNSALENVASLKGKNILVIDDGEIERKLYSSILEKAGCVVKAAPNGNTGLAAAHSQKFDLILLDYMMPDMDGFEVCRRLKMDHATKLIPVIFLTGSVKPEGVITCYDVGAECYLAKPISAETLTKQVQATLQQEVA